MTAIGFFYFALIIFKFVRDFLPTGLLATESIKKTQRLFYFLFVVTLVRVFAVLGLVLDFFNQIE